MSYGGRVHWTDLRGASAPARNLERRRPAMARPVAALGTAAEFRARLDSLGLDLPFDEEVGSGPRAPLSQPYALRGRSVGNRFAILPMEGWDGTNDGRPTDLTRRRWRRFGSSGAKLIFGGEAVAVRPDGRGNPNQMMILDDTVGDLAALRELLVRTHEGRFGRSDDLLVGLQLTHSGRRAHPNVKLRLEPTILYHHPVIDSVYGVSPDAPVMTDGEVSRLVGEFVQGAVLSQRAGFDFVDIKHCHGYLGHEFLNAAARPGRYGGSFENRTRFLREVVEGIRSEAPGLETGVRLSVFDFVPFSTGPDGARRPAQAGDVPRPFLFGCDGSGVDVDLTEPLAFLDLLESLDVRLFCMSAGGTSPLGGPGLGSWRRGHRPPEEPLVAVARLIGVAAELKRGRPGLTCVGAGYSYLQQWLP
ncbi:MAG: NADH:flavin oxidoreductase, partial [Gemmatimonadetes bacterium]|nr:NADH:flavin oxidoreductase [Gemmatimonadota bacterium]